jgi:tripartite-type tricarboxylate transporter receptor subunit TctC
MSMDRRRFGQSLFAGVAATALSPLAASAQSGFPTRPITMVVPLPAGGTADILARIAAEQLRALGQTVVVENRAGGAGGLVGMDYVNNSKPDGYTIVCAPQLTYSIMNVINPKVTFDLGRFEPVSVIASYPAVLLVRGDLPVNSVAELIAYAKANPGKLNYGSQGNGQIGHLAMEQFKQMTKTDLVHVPFRGSAPAIVALTGGQIDVMFDLLPATLPLVEAKKLKLIAVGSDKRMAALPNVPSVSETLKGFAADTWMGVAAPPATPKDVVKILSDAIGKGIASPEVNKRIAAMNVEPRGTTPEGMAQLIRESAARWTPVIKAGKITI